MDRALSYFTGVAVLLAAASPTAGQTGDLDLRVSGVRSASGMIRAALVDGQDRLVASRAVPARAGSVRLHFGGLAPGRYAVRLYHDEDGNGRMNRTRLGLPAEGYGFSNGARAGLFGPPALSRMLIEVRPPATASHAVMQY